MRGTIKSFLLVVAVALLVVSAAVAQGPPPPKPEDKQQEMKEEFPPEVEGERGFFEFGFRTFWGDVYGRPDLAFTPNLATSKLNEYSDIRKNFLVRRALLHQDNVLGARNYVDYQTQSAFYNNQS